MKGALAAMLALVAACNGSGEGMRTVNARIGDTAVTLQLPDGLATEPVPGGVAIRPPDADSRRTIHAMTLTAGDGAAGQGEAPGDRTRGSGPEAIRYAVTREDGGSGGEQVTLIANRACGAVPLRLRFDFQAEDDGEGEIDRALTILASARCSDR